MRVRAVHHGDVVIGQRFIGRESLNLLDDEERLVLLVVGLVDDYGATAGVFGPEVLLLTLLIKGDYAVRGVEDGLGRAIVLVEDDYPGVREVVLEVEDVADVRAAPGVDRLVGVADDTDIAVTRGPLLGEDVLGDVRVLELVDMDVQIAVGVLFEAILALVEQLHGLEQDVVEVERLVLLEQVLVAEEDT